MKLAEVVNKDGALLWLKEKIDEGWTTTQMKEMLTLTTGIPAECGKVLHKILVRLEILEFESWAHKRKVRCEECGYRRVMTIKLSTQNGRGVWIPGMTCPKCSSEKFYPVVEAELIRGPIFRRYWTGNPVLALALILVISINVFVTIRSGSTRVRKVEEAIFLCQEDGKFFTAPISFYPIKCPGCGKRTALMAVQCEECGHIYVWLKINWEKQPPICPKCGSKKSSQLEKIPK